MPNFDKEAEMVWKPVVERHGFSDFRLVHGRLDEQHCVDARAVHNPTGKPVSLALRTRYMDRYYDPSYLEQFTLRSKLPSGYPTERDKMFGDQNRARLMCYGWAETRGAPLDYYVAFFVEILRELDNQFVLDEQCLEEVVENHDGSSTMNVYSIPCIQAYTDDQGIMFCSDGHPGVPEPIRPPQPTVRGTIVPRPFGPGSQEQSTDE